MADENRDVVVKDNNSPVGTIIGIIVLIALVLLALFAFGAFDGDEATNGNDTTDVNIEATDPTTGGSGTEGGAAE